MKGYVYCFLVLFMIGSLAAGCQSSDVQSFEDLYQGIPTEISILDGSRGLAYSTEDEDMIQAFMEQLHPLSLSKSEDQEPRVGYLYYVDFFENGTQAMRITVLGDKIGVNQVYYRLERDISDLVEQYYEKIASHALARGPGTEGHLYVMTEEGIMYYELPGCMAGQYRGDVKDDFPHGQGRWISLEGGEYNGQWKEGQFHGQGTYTWPDGQRYEGTWEEGFPHGEGTMYFPDGISLGGTWSGGRIISPPDDQDLPGEPD